MKNSVLIPSHTFHRKAPQTDTIISELRETGDFVFSRAFNFFNLFNYHKGFWIGFDFSQMFAFGAFLF